MIAENQIVGTAKNDLEMIDGNEITELLDNVEPQTSKPNLSRLGSLDDS